jgi:hypothetical protein
VTALISAQITACHRGSAARKCHYMNYLCSGLRLATVTVLLILVNGCANPGPTENLLSAAGFRTFIATTPQQQQHLQTLPKDTITAVSRDGNVYYVFADPANNQIYVGNQLQYQRYQRLRLVNNLVQARLETAQMNNATVAGRWGAWGRWGYW